MKKNLFFALVLISLISCSKEKVSEEYRLVTKSFQSIPVRLQSVSQEQAGQRL